MTYTLPVTGQVATKTAHESAINDAITARVAAAVSTSQGRPGELADLYTTRQTGNRDGDPLPWPVIAGPNGAAVQITGAGVVALRDRINLTDGRRYRLRASYQRTTDPSDPSGSTVRLRLRWLAADYSGVGIRNVSEQTLTVAMGLQSVETTFSAAGAGAAELAPAGAVYAVPFVETFDVDGVTRLDALEVVAAEVAERVEVQPRNTENAPHFPTFVTGQTGARDVFTDLSLTYNPGTNTLRAPVLDADEIILDPEFIFERENIPDFPVARTFYVSMTGDDENTGSSLSKPLRTINAALSRMAAEAPSACVAIVHPGEYVVQPDSAIPANCTLYGYDLRVTKLALPSGQRENNMFRMASGIKVRGFSFTGMQHNSFTFDAASNTYVPPTKGFAFVFAPGAFIVRSPYIADCTVIHDFTQEQLNLPIDREAGNPLIPRGCGNILADGSVLAPSSPLRSVVVDSFTSVDPNGVAYLVNRNAFVQLVSVFTNWSRVGIWAVSGGQVTLANSNNTFGDYAFAATGFRNAIQIPNVTPDIAASAAAATAIESNLEAIVVDLMTTRYPANLTGWASFTAAQIELTERDTRTLLTALIGDFNSGQDRATQRFTKGLFDWNAEYVFAPSLLTAFLQSYDQIELAVRVFVTGTAPRAMLASLITMLKAVLTTPAAYRVAFPSVIEASGQQFSNAGSGVNYNSLPFSQRGTAIFVDPTTALIEHDGGEIYATFATEAGDTYLGKDLRVDFRRSTIEGQAFSRGVQNIALPLIIGLGG